MRRLAVLLLLAGCGGDAIDGWSGSVETLPNGAVRVMNTPQGAWRHDTGWRLVPELVVGTVDGPEPTVFAAVSGVEVDADGRIYVLDRQANELRIFSADGAHVRSVGRSGEGPGEYSNANGLRWITADSLLVIDQRGNRYSILDHEGEYVRSVPRALGFYGWTFTGGYDNGTLYEFTTVQVGDERRPVLLGTSLQSAAPIVGPPEASGDPDEVAATRRATVDTVFLPNPSGPLYEAFSVRNESGGMVMGVPFAPEPVYRVDDHGRIWHGHGSEFRIVRSSFAGDTTMEVLLDAEPAPVTTAELEAWEEGPGVARFRERGGVLDLGRIPKVKPYFDDLLVDAEGYIWVFMPAAPMQVSIAIFDPEGRYLGRLYADGFNRNAYVPPVARNGRLYIVGTDDLDVQHVYVFRIDDRAGEGVAGRQSSRRHEAG